MNNIFYLTKLQNKEFIITLVPIFKLRLTTYNIKLSKKDRKMFEKWDLEDTLFEWEKIKRKKINKLK